MLGRMHVLQCHIGESGDLERYSKSDDWGFVQLMGAWFLFRDHLQKNFVFGKLVIEFLMLKETSLKF